MPTIAFVSPKGGAGKTTSAFLLATALARFQEVTVIDADPNHPIETWANGGNAPEKLQVIADVDEDTIIERIEDAASKTPFVIIDLEGTASKIVVYAISQADLVIIPTQGSQLDANEAGRAIRVVMQSQKMTKERNALRSASDAHTSDGAIARPHSYSKRPDQRRHSGVSNGTKRARRFPRGLFVSAEAGRSQFRRCCQSRQCQKQRVGISRGGCRAPEGGAGR